MKKYKTPLGKIIQGITPMNDFISELPNSRYKYSSLLNKGLNSQTIIHMKSIEELPSEAKDTYNKIHELYEEIKKQINLLNDKINLLIKKENEDLLTIVKQRILKLQDELKYCEKIIIQKEENEMKLRNNEVEV